MDDTAIAFRLLGTVEALRDGRPVALPGARARALLAALLLAPNEVVSRDRLVDALWGERPPESVANGLQVQVHALRKALGRDRVATRGGGYALDVRPGELDSERFQQLVASGEAALAADDAAGAASLLAEACALWRGPALGELASEPFARADAARLDELRSAALELRIEAELALGRHARLVGELEQLVAEHPLRERLRGQLMLALYRCGRQAEALEAYQKARRTLVEELGIEPGPALAGLERAILLQDPDLDLPAPAQPAAALPSPPTSLLGRELEVASVSALLRGGARLLTLTGPGGTGKTRLAIAVARELGGEHADGAAFVDLSAVAGADRVPSAIAEALGVRSGSAASAEDALAEHLRERRLLLVLDNLEHVLAAAPLVGRLLRAAPALRILATSRAPLRVSGEQEYGVPPLALPRPGRSDPDTLAHSPAVALFTERARAVQPDWRLTEHNAEAVAAICRALDGLPLAIELAAARSKLLAPEAMLARLSGRLRLLTGGARDLPVRQQTLRAAIDWSYELLGEPERALLASVAVFSGAFTLEAAEAICDADLETLASLVDKSLLTRVGDGRLRMLETLREYAQERLETAEIGALRRRHALHHLALAEEAVELSTQPGEHPTALARIAAALDDLRAAAAWARSAGEVDIALAISAALGQHSWLRGYLAQSRFDLAASLALPGGSAGVRARALAADATLAFRQADVEAAAAEWQEALELARAAGDGACERRVLGELGGVAYARGNLRRARELYEESAALMREAGDDMRLAIVLDNLGEVAWAEGDLAATERLRSEALAIQERRRDLDGITVTLFNLGRTAMEVGQHERASGRFERGLRIAAELGYPEMVGYHLAGLAQVAASRLEFERAARLLAAARVTMEEIGAPLQPGEQAAYERTAGAVRTLMGHAAYERAAAAGAGLALEQRVAYALPGGEAEGALAARPGSGTST